MGGDPAPGRRLNGPAGQPPGTAVATIRALIPKAPGLTGEGGFVSQPPAIVVIGGLLSATLLTPILGSGICAATARLRAVPYGSGADRRPTVR